MGFQNFGFPEVQKELGLTYVNLDLYDDVPALGVSAEFLRRVTRGNKLAQAIDTEKARSEFVIAPILMELQERLDDRIGLFSGVILNVDVARGLNGVCDFLLTRSTVQDIVTAPAVAIVEAKNEHIRSGLGQCIAAMVAIWEFNQRAEAPVPVVHGVVTTGGTWKFLRLIQAEVTADRREYHLSEVSKILGILAHIMQPV